jgi:hypothetical protein
MIHIDEKGNKYIRMVDGSVVPLPDVALTIRIETVSNGLILPINDALAAERACAIHWFMKFQEAQTTIADLREQLAAKG